jgi:hypothetical protein
MGDGKAAIEVAASLADSSEFHHRRIDSQHGR